MRAFERKTQNTRLYMIHKTKKKVRQEELRMFVVGNQIWWMSKQAGHIIYSVWLALCFDKYRNILSPVNSAVNFADGITVIWSIAICVL